MRTSSANDSVPDRYTAWEYERRFLIDMPPDDFAVKRKSFIFDRYITNTRLRLRKVEDAETEAITYLLGHKRVSDPADLSRMFMTNMYLSKDEYDVFAALPADELHKTRYVGSSGSTYFSVDKFKAPHEGLLIASVDFSYRETMNSWKAPSWLENEVTNDEKYTGAALARA